VSTSRSTAQASAASLPATLRLGPVHITVSDLERSLAFYEPALGLRVLRREDGTAALGAEEDDVVVLHERPGAQRAGRHAGLYHYALLYPSHEELARAAMRLIATQTPVDGASDHGTHEAIYLSDPDGNGIELAADRPREQWPSYDEMYVAGPQPLDFHDLLASVIGEPTRPHVAPGLRVGHVHLHVGDVERGLAFYHDVLGFDVVGQLPTAAFVSAGGYHHHLAFNTWRGPGVPAPPEDAVGLEEWTVELDDPADVAAVRDRLAAAGIDHEERPDGLLVRDPWGIPLLIRPRPA
jgi:catechol 2,3-dioxygenase